MMPLLKKYFLIFVSGLLASPLFAQDIHLSQYYTSNISLNPAYTGFYSGDIRVTCNYRSQWGQVNKPIRTNMFSFEKKKENFGDEIAWGLIVINDQLSTYNLSANKFFLSGSYQKKISANYFRAGIQAGLAHRSTDLNGQTFPDQWHYGTGTFNQEIHSGETGINDSYTYPDFNAGLGWFRFLGKTRVAAGYGLFHLSRPRANFIGDFRLPFRHVFNASAIHPLSESLHALPYLLYMNSATATDFVFGSNLKKYLSKTVNIQAGAGYRGSRVNSDAVILLAGFGYGRLDFAISYDITVSELSNNARNKSAIEFSLIYTTPRRFADKISIPCNRY